MHYGKKFEEKSFDSSQSIFTANTYFVISAIAAHFLYFRPYATYRVKRNFSKTIFEKHFSQILVFEVFCKRNKFPESRGDLFVTFDTLVLMSFLDDCGKCISSFLFFQSFPGFLPTSETAKTFSL